MNKNKNIKIFRKIIKKNIEKNYKITDEQKQKYREAKKRYRENMTDEQKQKLKDYRRDM